MAGRLYSSPPHGNSGARRGGNVELSRRDFVKSCAAASTAAAVGLGSTPATTADAPQKGGTLRVGFYIQAATMDPHPSRSKVDRQSSPNVYAPLVRPPTRASLNA